MSAMPPRAARKRTSPEVREVPIGEIQAHERPLCLIKAAEIRAGRTALAVTQVTS